MVAENQTVTIDVLANDTDANAGQTKTLISVSSTTLGGQVSIVNGKAVYVANADSFDLLRQPRRPSTASPTRCGTATARSAPAASTSPSGAPSTRRSGREPAAPTT